MIASPQRSQPINNNIILSVASLLVLYSRNNLMAQQCQAAPNWMDGWMDGFCANVHSRESEKGVLSSLY